jgi:tetrahydromethanopterin S-methyltransferase subunit H
MFEYSVKQKTYDIAGTKIGGEPGKVPTVMVGSMFYNKDKTVSDPSKGIFDKAKAEEHIRGAEEATDSTGVATMIDLVAENHVAAKNYLDFVVETTGMPIFLDVVSESEQAETLRYASEIGAMDRLILNSLNPHTSPKLYETIKETNLKTSVILTHSTRYLFKTDKSPVIDEILPKAEAAGVENILVDTAVLDIPTLGVTAKAINLIKDKYGYPCGCGAHNALASWKRLKEKYTAEAVTIVKGVTDALPTAIGADFVLYGPIKNASSFYPAVAMIDAAYTQLMMEKGVRPDRSHPRYKIG